MVALINNLSKYFLTLQFGGKEVKRWKTLQHNGVMFPPEYVPHNIPLVVKGTDVKLPPLAEEYATLYAKYLDTDYIKQASFRRNFWRDWKLTIKGLGIISLEDCDFSKIRKHVDKQRDKLNSLSKEEKQRIKDIKEQQAEKYKVALVDGQPQPVGNFRMEPSGIFMGRGSHPKLGSIKKRVYPEDVTLNLGKEAAIPETLKGHKWGKIIHDQSVEWLASWKDPINNKTKYVWLASHSDMRMDRDKDKFELARKLSKMIGKIREENTKNMRSSDPIMKQLATALYFIDMLALRVGNEKGEDQADTVGVTSLRVEHMHILDDASFRIKLDFLGKDSIRYVNEINVEEQVYKNLKEYMSNKTKDDELFERINSSTLNKYLQTFFPELTAKVFRTYNASFLFQEEIDIINKKYKGYDKPDKMQVLLDLYNKANVRVALLCNHQKNVSKGFKEQIKKIDDKIQELKEKKKDAKNPKKVQEMIKKLRHKKETKQELKNLSLGTSRTNYIDPRITVAFMKTHEIPIEKFFSKTLLEKFKWAFEVASNWVF
jgi:DNA topoisomerase-1